MSAISTVDESSSSSSSKSTGTLDETPEDDTTAEVVADTVTSPDITATATLVPPAAEKRVCPEDSADTDQILPDVDKTPSNEAMISPNTKVLSVPFLFQQWCSSVSHVEDRLAAYSSNKCKKNCSLYTS